MQTIGKSGFGKAKIIIYNDQKCVVKFMNYNNSESATLANCTINRS